MACEHFCSKEGGHWWSHFEPFQTLRDPSTTKVGECTFPAQTNCREHDPDGPYNKAEQEKADKDFMDSLEQGINRGMDMLF